MHGMSVKFLRILPLCKLFGFSNVNSLTYVGNWPLIMHLIMRSALYKNKRSFFEISDRESYITKYLVHVLTLNVVFDKRNENKIFIKIL